MLAKQQSLITVIIPAYNAEAYITKCIEHIIHQTYKTLEIIIVDDGSTDNTHSIITKYAKHDKRIKVLHQQNSGPSDARNNGLKNANGKYIHFHDSDDFIELDYYEKMATVFNLTNADILCGEVQEVNVKFPTFKHIEIFTSLRDRILKTQANMLNVVWRYLYKRDFLNKYNLRFPKGMFIGEDIVFSLMAMYYAHNVATVPNAVYHCMPTPQSLGKNFVKIMHGRSNGGSAMSDFHKFKHKNIDEVLTGYPYNLPSKTEVLEFMHMPIFKKTTYDDRIKYYMFGINYLTKRFYPLGNKTKYYIFGIYIFRTNTHPS
jgi:glycosyltransferase involved in cell wall biosynthesis